MGGVSCFEFDSGEDCSTSSTFEFDSSEDCKTSTTQESSTDEIEDFNCSICLELVYKPVVQACGHIFCFWCAFQAMNVRKESHCSVCRRPYKYFPRVCELLHFVLSKAAPEEYERRGNEIRRAEEQLQVFSPRLLESPKQTWSPRSLDEVAGLTSMSSTPRGVVTRNLSASGDKVGPVSVLCSESDNGREDGGCIRRDPSFMRDVLTVDDFRCPSCNDLLYCPVVLNCGEVFCEPCLKRTTSKVLYCPSCKAPHPGNSILICLELHQYLESAFPIDYSRRKLWQSEKNTQPLCCETGDEDCNTKTADVTDCTAGRMLHEGVGCDGCGMFPIEGFRYHCVECTEKTGFDLCGSCYEKGGSVAGRFNQEHRANHLMERLQCGKYRYLDFKMENGSIQRRRQQQQAVSDFDDYINSFVN